MRPDTPPDDVRVARADRVAVLKGRAAVRRPGQLPHTALTLHSLDAEPLVEPLGAKTGDKQSNRSQKRFALLARETGVLPQEPLALGVGRHPPS
jgi:hypothetical protein